MVPTDSEFMHRWSGKAYELFFLTMGTMERTGWGGNVLSLLTAFSFLGTAMEGSGGMESMTPGKDDGAGKGLEFIFFLME